MPIFAYLCNKCAKEFEHMVGVIEGSGEAECPYCKSRDIKKIFAPFSVGKTAVKSDLPCADSPSCQTCPGSGSCGI